MGFLTRGIVAFLTRSVMAEENDGEIFNETNMKLSDVPLEFFGLMLKEDWLENRDIPKIALCNKYLNAHVRTAMLKAVETIQ